MQVEGDNFEDDNILSCSNEHLGLLTTGRDPDGPGRGIEPLKTRLDSQLQIWWFVNRHLLLIKRSSNCRQPVLQFLAALPSGSPHTAGSQEECTRMDIMHPHGYRKLMRLCTVHKNYAPVWLPQNDEIMHPEQLLCTRMATGI